ncbi:MAG: transcription termination/antitermination protein NusG [Firmicutes bacterium]|nr:transcription termination/antitermination protein NusG [Candidatus Fiminaster equi]
MAELGEKHWYIVTTYSQHERKVADNLLKRVETLGLGDYITNVLVAEQEVPVMDKETGLPQQNKDGSTKTKMKNLFPGNIFVEMIMTDKVWYDVRNTPGVTGIAGSAGGGQKPTPVSKEEIEPVLKRMGIIDTTMYEHYNIGDPVRVIRGPLEGTEGKILSINKETGACRVETIFFGRSTPVDVDFSEIERL